MKFIRRLLSPPVFEDILKTQQAYLLNIILWVLIFVPVPFVIYTLTITPENISRTMIQTIIGETVNVILLFMLHRGYVKTASIVQVGAFWLFFTVTAITGAGVQAEAYLLGYGLVIAIAGVLLGGRGALVVTALSLFAGGLMVYAYEQGMLLARFVSTPLTTWVMSLVLFPVTAILQYLGSRVARQALARASASEERYRLISQVSSDYTFSTALNAEGKMYLNWVTGALERMTGYTFDEYVASGGWQGHLHPEDVEKDEKAFEQLRLNHSTTSEVRTFKKNGEIVWVRAYAHPVWDEKHGRLTGIVGAVQDITEQKQIEEELRRSESIYRRAIEVAGAVPYHQTFDAEGRIMYDFMGEGIRQITGYGPEEFNDDLWGAMVVERHLLEELEPYALDDAIQQVRTGNIPIWKCEHCIKARDGRIRWVFEAAVDLRDERGIAYGSVGLYQDITERKQAEEALKYERDLLQIFLDNIPDTVYFKDRESRFVRINSAQARLLGVPSAQDAIGKTDLDYQPPVLARSFMEEERSIIETGQPVINRVEFNPTKDGQLRWLSATKVPVKDLSGQVVGMIGISRDITEQKLAQEYEQNRRATLEKVLTLGQEVTEVQDIRTTLKRIWQGVRHDLNFDRTGIYLYDPATNTMNGTFGTNNRGEMVEEWDSHISLNDESKEAESFISVLNESDGLYVTHNYEAEHNIPGGHTMSGVNEFAAVAARMGDKPVAVICVDNLITGRPIANEQLEALRLFAGYAGLAIENSRLNDALQIELQQQKQSEEREVRRRFMLEKVVELGKQVTETTDFVTTLQRIWRSIHDNLDFDRLGIFLYNTESNSVNGTYGTDRQGEMVEEWNLHIPLDGETGETLSFINVIHEENGVYVTHNYAADRDIPKGHIMEGVRDYAAVAAWAGDKPMGVICVDNLITGRMITEEQLEALRLFAGYAGLAIQNARLNAALEEDLLHRQSLIEELEAKNAELERFTYTVSHDLKSPLVTITGFLGFVEKDALAGNTAKIKSSIDRISNAAQKMQGLLNDLLELSRIGRLMNKPENIPFNEITKEALDHVGGRLEANKVEVEVQASLPVVNGDKIRLVEVVQNLVDNAAKFTKSCPEPLIKIGTNGFDKKGFPIFFVSDNGIGIDPQYHEKIFGLFDKLDPTIEGTGVGLTLVKRIVEVHGGRIWLESQPGIGTTFYFTLPGATDEE